LESHSYFFHICDSIFFFIAFVANMVAASYHATIALPFSVILSILAMWIFIGLPLTVIGGITGKRSSKDFDAPVPPKNFPMQLPAIPYHRSLAVKMIVGGFLPFSSIYIELYYIFNNIWGFGTYQFWGILVLVFF